VVTDDGDFDDDMSNVPVAESEAMKTFRETQTF
jgi:hypothetical protein